MARPREFDPDQALQKALQVFWAHGYQDASLPDLLEGMGLTRGSLYKAFTDKKTLFLQVLGCYGDASTSVVSALTDPNGPDGAERIFNMFKAVVSAAEQGDTRGCLLCTTATGAEMADDDIADAVHAGLAGLKDAIEDALRSSARHKDLPNHERQILAGAVMTQYVGLRVLLRSGLPLGVVENSVAQVRMLLGQT